jgi:hypothetical protein
MPLEGFVMQWCHLPTITITIEWLATGKKPQYSLIMQMPSLRIRMCWGHFVNSKEGVVTSLPNELRILYHKHIAENESDLSQN